MPAYSYLDKKAYILVASLSRIPYKEHHMILCTTKPENTVSTSITEWLLWPFDELTL